MVCVDEVSQVLNGEVHALLPEWPGQAARQNYVCWRVDTANLFMITAPFAGWRHVEFTERDTKLDFPHILKDLVNVHFPTAEQFPLVCDNLHAQAHRVLYARYDAAIADGIPDVKALGAQATSWEDRRQQPGAPLALALYHQ